MVRLHIETTLHAHVIEAIDLIDEAGAACEWDNAQYVRPARVRRSWLCV